MRCDLQDLRTSAPLQSQIVRKKCSQSFLQKFGKLPDPIYVRRTLSRLLCIVLKQMLSINVSKNVFTDTSSTGYVYENLRVLRPELSGALLRHAEQRARLPPAVAVLGPVFILTRS